MSMAGDSAEEIVKLSLDGVEVLAKISGSMVEKTVTMLYAMAKDTDKKTKGKTRLKNMLKSKNALEVFSIKQEDYRKFKKQAKKYGILYSAILNKKSEDGLIDIIVRSDDAVRVNRIVKRFNITKVDTEEVEKVLEETSNQKLEEKESIKSEKQEIQKEIQEKNTSDELLNTLLKKQNIKEENENTNPSNITNTERETQLENSSRGREEKMEGTKKEEKPSIRKELNEIKEQKKQEEKVKPQEEKKKEKKDISETKHKQPKNKKKKKERSK